MPVAISPALLKSQMKYAGKVCVKARSFTHESSIIMSVDHTRQGASNQVSLSARSSLSHDHIGPIMVILGQYFTRSLVGMCMHVGPSCPSSSALQQQQQQLLKLRCPRCQTCHKPPVKLHFALSFEEPSLAVPCKQRACCECFTGRGPETYCCIYASLFHITLLPRNMG